MKLAILFLALLGGACTSVPKPYPLTDPAPHTAEEVQKCRADIIQILHDKNFVTLKNISKAYRAKKKLKDNNELAGLEKHLSCGSPDDAFIHWDIASAIGELQYQTGSDTCMYLPKTDEFGCIENIKEFPLVKTSMQTSTTALQQNDKIALDRLDTRTKNISPISLVESLQTTITTVEIESSFPPIDWRTNSVSLTSLKLLHQENALMEYLIDFQGRQPDKYKKVILENKTNRKIFTQALEDSKTAYKGYREAVTSQGATQRLPSSYYALEGIGERLRGSGTILELVGR